MEHGAKPLGGKARRNQQDLIGLLGAAFIGESARYVALQRAYQSHKIPSSNGYRCCQCRLLLEFSPRAKRHNTLNRSTFTRNPFLSEGSLQTRPGEGINHEMGKAHCKQRTQKAVATELMMLLFKRHSLCLLQTFAYYGYTDPNWRRHNMLHRAWT